MITLFKKTIKGLSKTRTNINNIISSFIGKSNLDSTDIENLEEALIGADLGWELTDEIINTIYEGNPDAKIKLIIY